MNATVGGELEAETTIAPGNSHPESGLADAGQRVNTTNAFLIEIDHLLRRFSVGHNGNVDSEDVACIEARLRHLQRMLHRGRLVRDRRLQLQSLPVQG